MICASTTFKCRSQGSGPTSLEPRCTSFNCHSVSPSIRGPVHCEWKDLDRFCVVHPLRKEQRAAPSHVHGMGQGTDVQNRQSLHVVPSNQNKKNMVRHTTQDTRYDSVSVHMLSRGNLTCQFLGWRPPVLVSAPFKVLVLDRTCVTCLTRVRRCSSVCRPSCISERDKAL